MKKRFLAAVLALVCLAGVVQAADKAAVIGLKAGETQLRAFVRCAEEVQNVTATLGRQECSVTEVALLEDAGLEMRTLILIDNSLSIPEASRASIQTELLELIAARKEKESFAIGTINEQVSLDMDFTSDYTQLRDILVNLVYQNQETYLTDALYDYLINDPFGNSWDSFDRILLISDGVDNKDLGYTKDELLTLLKESPVPLYTIGVSSGTNSNNTELENMFALARATGGESVLLQELGDGWDLVEIMEADWSALAVTVQIPEAAQDGSLQTLTLNLESAGGNLSVSFDNVRMPLQAIEAALDTTVEDADLQDQDSNQDAAESPMAPEPESSGGTPQVSSTTVIILVGGLLLLAVLVMAFLTARRNKKAGNADDGHGEVSPQQEPSAKAPPLEKGQKGGGGDAGTDLIGGTSKNDGDMTFRLWSGDDVYQITLTDINTPERFYEKMIDTSLLIGASQGSDICVSYDRTVSRKHCEIIREGTELFLVNHSQSNGTLLNGIRVTERVPLPSGSIIKMGRVEMRVEIVIPG